VCNGRRVDWIESLGLMRWPLREGSDGDMLGILQFFHPWSWLPVGPEQLTLERIA
jgi:hypothetical protein